MAMDMTPEVFAARYAAGRPFLMTARIVSDLLTPVSAYMRLSAGAAAYTFLLESVEGGAQRGRYSMIGLKPDLIWRCVDGTASVWRGAEPGDSDFMDEIDAPLTSLRAMIAEAHIEMADDPPPMATGLFGYLGYDMARLMERLPSTQPDMLGLPDAILMRPTLMAVFDALKDELVLVTPVRPDPTLEAARAYDIVAGRLFEAIDALAAPIPADRSGPDHRVTQNAAVSNTPRSRYLEMVSQAKSYIAAGDIFQVVLSQRFSAAFSLPSLALYRSLRRINPSPFLSHLDFGDFQIVCSSPEILVRLRDGQVTVRPIAGTRPRGATPDDDQALADSLLADAKERAEHLMLLDLGRNDVGRVSEIGSVRVTDSFFIERYSHVMHIVSNVVGQIAPGHDALDALIAGFPAGTVSGAPKIRAMEIIDELETAKRGVYGGAIGYFGPDGEMDTCIVLRTAIVKDGMIHVQAGAGVVHDSDPDAEHAECENKARALFRAAEDAARFVGRAGSKTLT